MDEKLIEQKIHTIAVTTLGDLKGVILQNQMDDRQATLTLHYFLTVFCKNAWKTQKPSDILNNTIKIIKETGNDTKNGKP